MNATVKGNRTGAPSTQSLLTKLNRLSETAKKNPQYQFANLVHIIDVEMLSWAFQGLRKDASAGVDGVTAKDYEKNLKSNLEDLYGRMKEGRYRAQPLRRVYIEKEDGNERPISIPTLDDKICQKAAAELLSRIFENDFLPVSYGYRPGRSPHDALDAIQRDLTLGNVNYILDADISDYFGSIVREKLKNILKRRITDKHLLALIGKWLKVGIIDDGQLLTSENGTYQGSVCSPVLANVYLHEVLDLWVENDVKPHLRGEIKLYRFADDFIATFEYEEDAKKFLQVLPKRFAKFGLTLNPEKTRMIEFGRAAWIKGKGGRGKPNTFNFLGLTHYCGTSLKGKFIVKVKTMSKRLKRGIKRVMDRCRELRHRPLEEQYRQLKMILYGHYAYYGRRNNIRSLQKFYRRVLTIWKKWLGRRGSGFVKWEKFTRTLERYPLPKPRIVQGILRSRYQLNLFGEFI